MPQLDKFSFFPQLIWFFSIFFGIYVLFSQSVLPTVARAIKLRERTLDNVTTSVASQVSDQKDVLVVLNNVVNAQEKVISKLHTDMKNSTLALDLAINQSSVASVFKEEVVFQKIKATPITE